jgi:hypothetical protein
MISRRLGLLLLIWWRHVLIEGLLRLLNLDGLKVGVFIEVREGKSLSQVDLVCRLGLGEELLV